MHGSVIVSGTWIFDNFPNLHIPTPTVYENQSAFLNFSSYSCVLEPAFLISTFSKFLTYFSCLNILTCLKKLEMKRNENNITKYKYIQMTDRRQINVQIRKLLKFSHARHMKPCINNIIL